MWKVSRTRVPIVITYTHAQLISSECSLTHIFDCVLDGKTISSSAAGSRGSIWEASTASGAAEFRADSFSILGRLEGRVIVKLKKDPVIVEGHCST